jgi:hypothetical protein
MLSRVCGYLASPARATAPLVLAVVLGAVGCVTLDRPPVVEECAKNNTCKNGAVAFGADAKEGSTSDGEQPDLPPGDEPSVAKDALGSDRIAATPDAGPDEADSSPEKTDDVGADPASPEVALPADRGPDSPSDRVPPTDLRLDGGKDRAAEEATGNDDVANDDASKDDVTRDDVSKNDVAMDDVNKDDIVKDDLVKDDVTRQDVAPEAPIDVPTDIVPSNCKIFFGSSPSTGSAGHPGSLGMAATCVATCDGIAGWNCSNDDGRTVTVNGTVVKCGAAISKSNGYFVFQVGAGTNRDFAIFWWADSGNYATSCAASAGGS